MAARTGNDVVAHFEPGLLMGSGYGYLTGIVSPTCLLLSLRERTRPPSVLPVMKRKSERATGIKTVTRTSIIPVFLVKMAPLLTPTENRATSARRVLGLVATLHQNSECENNETTWTQKMAQR